MKADPILIRRELHQIPELAFEEYKTKALILSYLQDLKGILIHEFRDSTGILVEYAHGKGKFKLFRADMDALPFHEQTDCDFRSTHAGVMHACGHDVHISILLGLIFEIVERQVPLNILFLFQPAEEGKGGAQRILGENKIQGYPIESAFALHINPKLKLNQISTKAGIFFAIPQEFDVSFHGKTAHAAFPEEGRNALKAGVDFYQAMQAQAQELIKLEPMIFHIGKFKSGVIRNVIPDLCVCEGTHRSLSKWMQEKMNDLIRQEAATAAKQSGVQCEIDFLCSYDPVINDDYLYQKLKGKCPELGVEFIESPIYMTGEDFGYFTSMYPGMLFWLGANDPDHDLHSELLLPDDACIPIGIKIFLSLALDN